MLLPPILTRSRAARAKLPDKNRGLRIENRRSRHGRSTIPVNDLRFSFFGLSILNSRSSTGTGGHLGLSSSLLPFSAADGLGRSTAKRYPRPVLGLSSALR